MPWIKPGTHSWKWLRCDGAGMVLSAVSTIQSLAPIANSLGRIDANLTASPILPPLRYCLSGNRLAIDGHERGSLPIHGSGLGVVPLEPSNGPKIRLTRAH